MAGVVIAHPDGLAGREPLAAAGDAKHFHRLLDVGGDVERQGRLVLRVAFAIGVFGVLLLALGRVEHDQLGELAGRLSGVDRPKVALADDPRQVAGVVEVGVREDDGLECLDVERRGGPIEQSQRLESLEQPAIHEHSRGARLEEEL